MAKQGIENSGIFYLKISQWENDNHSQASFGYNTLPCKVKKIRIIRSAYQ